MGNLTAGNKKTAPNVFHSEPFSNFEIIFRFRAVLPLTLLFIGGQAWLEQDLLTEKTLYRLEKFYQQFVRRMLKYQVEGVLVYTVRWRETRQFLSIECLAQPKPREPFCIP